MAQLMAKNASHGVFTSQSAVRSRPQHDVNRLYFRTTSNVEFSHKEQLTDDRPENMGNIHFIGMKSTKYLPYQHRSAPLQNKSACWYTHDFCEKPSEFLDNRELAKTFAFRPAYQKSPSFGTKSHYSHTFPSLTPSEIKGAKPPNQSPYRVADQRKAIGGDILFTKDSFSHHKHKAPPKDIKATGELSVPVHNLELSSKLHNTDNGDMMKTMYKADFQGTFQGTPGSKDRRGRVSSAPSLVSGTATSVATEATDVSEKTDSNIHKVRRMVFMSPGK